MPFNHGAKPAVSETDTDTSLVESHLCTDSLNKTISDVYVTLYKVPCSVFMTVSLKTVHFSNNSNQ